jgi:hypothetical protein
MTANPILRSGPACSRESANSCLPGGNVGVCPYLRRYSRGSRSPWIVIPAPSGNPFTRPRPVPRLLDSCLVWSGLRPQPKCLLWRNGWTDLESAAVRREFDALEPPAVKGTATSVVMRQTCKRASRSRLRRRLQLRSCIRRMSGTLESLARGKGSPYNSACVGIRGNPDWSYSIMWVQA